MFWSLEQNNQKMKHTHGRANECLCAFAHALSSVQLMPARDGSFETRAYGVCVRVCIHCTRKVFSKREIKLFIGRCKRSPLCFFPALVWLCFIQIGVRHITQTYKTTSTHTCKARKTSERVREKEIGIIHKMWSSYKM